VQAAFEQSPTGLLLLAADGVIHAANPSAGRMLGQAPSTVVGRALWDLVAAVGTADDVSWFRHAVASAAAGRRGELVSEHDFNQPGGQRTTAWTVRAVRSADDPVIAIAEGRDVTAARLASTEKQILFEIALALCQADSLEVALSALLQAICEAAGWLLGEAWLPTTGPGAVVRLTRGGVWAVPDRRLQSFVTQGSGFAFGAGEGLPGTAWQRRELVWANSLSDAGDFTRAPLATLAGLRSAVAIPVLAGGEPVAVISGYMEDSRPPDARPIRVASAVATQLGPLLQQKQTEEARRNAEAQLAGTVAIAMDAIISIDEERRITLFNWGAERIFGYSADEVLGQSLDMLLPELLRARHAGQIAQFSRSAQTARRMGERSTITGQRKNGEIFPAEASISRYLTGGRWTFTVMLRDITDRQRAEEGLRFLADVGALLADLLHDPSALQRAADRAVPMLGDSCIIDLVEGAQILTASVAARDAAMAQAIQALRDRQPPRWDVPTAGTQAMRTRQTGLLSDAAGVGPGGEAPAIGADAAGSVPKAGSLLVVPLVAHDQLVGAATFAMMAGGRKHDETYRALAEAFGMRVALAVDSAALYQRARRAIGARDEAMAVVSHDLRNPLSAITLCLSALRESPPPSPEAATDLLGTVVESTTLMQRIIQDLLDVASIDAGRLSLDRRRQAVLPVLERSVAMFRAAAADRDVALVLDRTALDGIPDAEIDSERIVQVLANLLHNALKFTDAGGTVRVSAVAKADRIAIAVADTGAGIAPADLPHIFDRFWHGRRRTKIRSTGLGLAIARGIVEAHGGRIWADSAPGRGTSLTFEIPTAGDDQSVQ
jgi:PAS domain S-box-containing protein